MIGDFLSRQRRRELPVDLSESVSEPEHSEHEHPGADAARTDHERTTLTRLALHIGLVRLVVGAAAHYQQGRLRAGRGKWQGATKKCDMGGELGARTRGLA